MKVRIENRNGAKVVRIITSSAQERQDSEGRYYYVYLTVFVIEKQDGEVILVKSEVDRALLYAQVGVFNTKGRKSLAFRKGEDDAILKAALKTSGPTEGAG